MGRIDTFPLLDGPVVTEYPVGCVLAYAGTTAPYGWLLCDGSAVSRTTYAALFAVLGVQYGSGDGSLTFNLPNIKGRTIVGRDAGDTDWDVLGETRGTKTHTLAATEVPNHGHTLVNNGSHNHAYSNAWTNAQGDGGTDINRYHVAVGVPNDRGLGTASNGDHGHSVNATTGGGGAHNNIQPSLVLNYIIRAEPRLVLTPGLATVPDYAARKYRNADWNAPSGFSQFPLDTIDYDRNGCFSGDNYVVQRSGLYVVTGRISAFVNNTFQEMIPVIRRGPDNTTWDGAGPVVRNATNGDILRGEVHEEIQATAGETIQLCIWNSGPNTINVREGQSWCALTVRRVGDRVT